MTTGRDIEWIFKRFHSDDDWLPSTEIHMVAGLLRWIVQAERDPYCTRSGLVARTDGYLKVAGYNIGSIEAWSGSNPRPNLFGPRNLALVLGGSEDTDQLMADEVEMKQTGPQQHHYTFITVGSLLHHTLSTHVIIRPEVL
jgi:hypothetical protein